MIGLFLSGLLAITSISGCSLIKPIPDSFSISINTSSDLNPDDDDRSSPVVLRVYELSDDKLFNESDFFDLYDEDSEVFETAFYLKKQEMELNPNESRKLDMTLSDDTKYVGFIAAYRDIDAAKWREVHSITKQRATGVPVYSSRGLVVDLKKNKIVVSGK